MKHVNLDPELEKKKAEAMKQFRADDAPAAAPSPLPGAPARPTARVMVNAPGVGVAPPSLQPAPQPTQPSPQPSPQTESQPTEPVAAETLKERVIEALKGIYDPEIPVNIYDLGLIYRVDINDGFAAIDMTLTAPGCPVAQTFPGVVEGAVRLVPGITGAAVELVWEPPWTQARISEAARLELGLI